DGGKVSLLIDGYDSIAKTASFAIATFATKAEADAVTSLIRPRKLPNGFSGILSVVETEMGFTIFANYARRGMMLLFH
ncbi:MAG: hypothetical protein IKO55_08685, partial [Kiritimatiellae bacterium]|nr:hypothetical protein [Kiritimatiellia bacterium]